MSRNLLIFLLSELKGMPSQRDWAGGTFWLACSWLIRAMRIGSPYKSHTAGSQSKSNNTDDGGDPSGSRTGTEISPRNHSEANDDDQGQVAKSNPKRSHRQFHSDPFRYGSGQSIDSLLSRSHRVENAHAKNHHAPNEEHGKRGDDDRYQARIDLRTVGGA